MDMSTSTNIENNKKQIPIECCIDTKSANPISWTRRIKSNVDRSDFEKLIKIYEENGIIETSTSMWMNPVVLTKEKY